MCLGREHAEMGALWDKVRLSRDIDTALVPFCNEMWFFELGRVFKFCFCLWDKVCVAAMSLTRLVHSGIKLGCHESLIQPWCASATSIT